MKNFMCEDFLLSNDTAKKLYHDYASSMPIIDYHCHISPKEIAENRTFDNISEAWLGGDHYKWRGMRSNGIDEKFITGDAAAREKFQKWAETLTKAIGNPLYHWTHLELKKYFGYTGALNGNTAEEVWTLCNEKLTSPALSVRGIIESSNVKLICTTDDPIDSLEYHLAIKNDPTCKVKVLPAWRPDKAMNVDDTLFTSYIEKLGEVSQTKISTLENLFSALRKRLDFFDTLGCKASDHGINYVPYNPAPLEEINGIFCKALLGEAISADETEKYKTALLIFFGTEYAKRSWVMQLHYGVIRNTNSKMLANLGPDTGFDCIATAECANGIVGFLNALDEQNHLPKTILYSLNPGDNEMLGTILGCFQGTEIAGKIQHGSAWWFNDTKTGMTKQLTNLANLSLLGNFIGMLTDSRSFLSYTRHEYFRRILCNLIGTWVENGEYPNDIEALGQMVQDISYNNAVNYFEFEID